MARCWSPFCRPNLLSWNESLRVRHSARRIDWDARDRYTLPRFNHGVQTPPLVARQICWISRVGGFTASWSMMPTGHYPMETMPQELAHMLREVACNEQVVSTGRVLQRKKRAPVVSRGPAFSLFPVPITHQTPDGYGQCPQPRPGAWGLTQRTYVLHHPLWSVSFMLWSAAVRSASSGVGP